MNMCELESVLQESALLKIEILKNDKVLLFKITYRMQTLHCKQVWNRALAQFW